MGELIMGLFLCGAASFFQLLAISALRERLKHSKEECKREGGLSITKMKKKVVIHTLVYVTIFGIGIYLIQSSGILATLY